MTKQNKQQDAPQEAQGHVAAQAQGPPVQSGKATDALVANRRHALEVTGFAALIAAVVLVLAVLPAEYGVDPTGFGDLVGIKNIAAPDGSGPSIHAIEETAYRTDSVNITLSPGQGLEYKFHVKQASGFVYTWQSNPVYFDFHGEPTNTTGYFESYQTGTQREANGSFNAPFTGTHGWYWRNDANHDVVIHLQTAGHYDIVGIV